MSQKSNVRLPITTERNLILHQDKRIFFYLYENNQQDALYRLIYYSKSALHVSGDVFAHHQEHLTVFTVPDTVNTVKCS